MADLLASEYHWSHEVIWWQLSITEIMLYVNQIKIRKTAQNGGDEDEPLDDSLINLLEVIDLVKKERANAKR